MGWLRATPQVWDSLSRGSAVPGPLETLWCPVLKDPGCPCGERVGENREPWEGAAPRPRPSGTALAGGGGALSVRGSLRPFWLAGRASRACPQVVPLPAALCFALTRSLLLTCLVPAGLLGLRYYYSRKVILAYLDCALHTDMADIEQYYMKPSGESPGSPPPAPASWAEPPLPQQPQARPGVRAKRGWPHDLRLGDGGLWPRARVRRAGPGWGQSWVRDAEPRSLGVHGAARPGASAFPPLRSGC